MLDLSPIYREVRFEELENDNLVSFRGDSFQSYSFRHLCIIHTHDRINSCELLLNSIITNVTAHNYQNDITILILNDNPNEDLKSQYLSIVYKMQRLIGQFEQGNIKIRYFGYKEISLLLKKIREVDNIPDSTMRYFFSNTDKNEYGGIIGSQNIGSLLAFGLVPDSEESNTILTHFDDDILLQFVPHFPLSNGKVVLSNKRNFFLEKDIAFNQANIKLFGSENYTGFPASYTTDFYLALQFWNELFDLKWDAQLDIQVILSKILRGYLQQTHISIEQLIKNPHYLLEGVTRGSQPFFLLTGDYQDELKKTSIIMGGNTSLRITDIIHAHHMTCMGNMHDIIYSNVINILFPGSVVTGQQIGHLRNTSGRVNIIEGYSRESYKKAKVIANMLENDFRQDLKQLKVVLENKKKNTMNVLSAVDSLKEKINISHYAELKSVKELIDFLDKFTNEKQEILRNFAEPSTDEYNKLSSQYQMYIEKQTIWPRLLMLGRSVFDEPNSILCSNPSYYFGRSSDYL